MRSHMPSTMISEHEPPASFPEIPLIKHVGIPTSNCLDELQKHLNACTASVHSNLGCGTLGLIAMSMDPPLFATVCTTTSINVVNDGAYPTVPVSAITSQITLIYRTQK